MDINVTLYGRLRDYLPREQRGKVALSSSDVATVKDVLAAVGIDEQVTVSVNSEQEVEMTRAVVGGDKVLVFAPTAGGSVFGREFR